MKTITDLLFTTWECPDCGEEHTSPTALAWAIVVACIGTLIYAMVRR